MPEPEPVLEPVMLSAPPAVLMFTLLAAPPRKMPLLLAPAAVDVPLMVMLPRPVASTVLVPVPKLTALLEPEAWPLMTMAPSAVVMVLLPPLPTVRPKPVAPVAVPVMLMPPLAWMTLLPAPMPTAVPPELVPVMAMLPASARSSAEPLKPTACELVVLWPDSAMLPPVAVTVAPDRSMRPLDVTARPLPNDCPPALKVTAPPCSANASSKVIAPTVTAPVPVARPMVTWDAAALAMLASSEVPSAKAPAPPARPTVTASVVGRST